MFIIHSPQHICKERKRIAVCATSTTTLWKLTCHMGSHSITCHPAEVTFPLLPQPIEAGTRFSDPRGMQGWVDLVGLVTYRGGIPAQRRSPIPALTGLNVEQLRSCDANDATTALNRQLCFHQCVTLLTSHMASNLICTKQSSNNVHRYHQWPAMDNWLYQIKWENVNNNIVIIVAWLVLEWMLPLSRVTSMRKENVSIEMSLAARQGKRGQVGRLKTR